METAIERKMGQIEQETEALESIKACIKNWGVAGVEPLREKTFDDFLEWIVEHEPGRANDLVVAYTNAK